MTDLSTIRKTRAMRMLEFAGLGIVFGALLRA